MHIEFNNIMMGDRECFWPPRLRPCFSVWNLHIFTGWTIDHIL